jgi:hypothetical protein
MVNEKIGLCVKGSSATLNCDCNYCLGQLHFYNDSLLMSTHLKNEMINEKIVYEANKSRATFDFDCNYSLGQFHFCNDCLSM